MVKYSTLLGAAGVASALAMPQPAGSLARRADYGNAVVARPLAPHQVTAGNLDTKSDNVLVSESKSSIQAAADPATAVDVEFVNNFSGGSLSAYVTGKDSNGQAAFWLPDGSNYIPDNPADGSAPVAVDQSKIRIPLGGVGSSTPFTMSKYIDSGRVYFSTGDLYFAVNHGDAGPTLREPSSVDPTDPSSNLTWGFSEFTFNADNLFGNISFVDFVGLVVAMVLEGSAGSQEVKGLPGDAIPTICQSLKDQAGADGGAWDQLCVLDSSNNPVRVLAPKQKPDVFSGYYTQYVDDVYNMFNGSPLTINTPGNGDVTGNGDGSNINFDGVGSYGKPNEADIFGCSSGPFVNEGTDEFKAIGARMCAAFNRATWKLDGGNTQPNGPSDVSQWYGSAPANYYSKFVHANEIDQRGYAFPYDDVLPAGQPDVAGTVKDAAPTKWTLTVGGVQ